MLGLQIYVALITSYQFYHVPEQGRCPMGTDFLSDNTTVLRDKEESTLCSFTQQKSSLKANIP
jgi:hypothetical protein